MMMGVRKVYVDMDGVLANFVKASYAVHGIDIKEHPADCWGFFEHWPMSATQFWKGIENAGRDFWASLEPYPWAQDLLWAVSRYNWAICTTPSLSPLAQAGKMDWLHKHIDRGFRHFHFTATKEDLAKSGTILIDDHNDNVEKFRAAGGAAILFPQTWNDNAHEADDPLAYVTDQLDLYEEVMGE